MQESRYIFSIKPNPEDPTEEVLSIRQRVDGQEILLPVVQIDLNQLAQLLELRKRKRESIHVEPVKSPGIPFLPKR